MRADEVDIALSKLIYSSRRGKNDRFRFAEPDCDVGGRQRVIAGAVGRRISNATMLAGTSVSSGRDAFRAWREVSAASLQEKRGLI